MPVKKNTDSAVYLVQGYRDKENKVKHRKIKLYGFLSDLEKEDPNILEKLKKEAKTHQTKALIKPLPSVLVN